MFVDAVEMNKKYPKTFGIPSTVLLKAGQYVKISENHERFWVMVQAVNGDKITGIVDNQLVCKHSFKLGDVIEFEKRHVMGIMQL